MKQSLRVKDLSVMSCWYYNKTQDINSTPNETETAVNQHNIETGGRFYLEAQCTAQTMKFNCLSVIYLEVDISEGSIM